MKTVLPLFVLLLTVVSPCFALDVDVPINAEVVDIQRKALLLLEKGKVDEAIAYLDTQSYGDNPGSRLIIESTKAKAYVQLGKPRRAIEIYRELLREKKENWALRNDLADAYALVGEHESAFRELKRYLKNLSLVHANTQFEHRLLELQTTPGNTSATAEKESLKELIKKNESLIGTF